MEVLHRGVTQGEEGTALHKEPEMPALPTNLVRVGSTYKYRSRIPQDLLKLYHPKREVTESLRTTSLAEARRLLPAIQLKYQAEWANLRAALSDHLTELVITDASITYLTTLYEHESLSGDEATRLAQNYTLEEIKGYRERYAESNALLRDAASIGDIECIRPALDQYLGLKRIRVTGSEADYKRLALAYLHRAIKTNSALLARMTGEAIPTPKEPRLGVAAPVPGVSVIPIATHPSSFTDISLHSLYTYWRDAVPGRPLRTIEDFRRRVEQMDALTGHTPGNRLTKNDFIAFRDAMLAKGKATATVEKDLSFLKTIMRYAHESGKIPSNPTEGLKVSQRKVSTTVRRKLQTDDLNRLFSPSIYVAGERPQGGGREAAAWVPLIGLYTGARLEEICQLRMADIQEQGGIHCFNIIDLEDDALQIKTSVKTDESRRQVPIHPELIQAGFLAYVAHCKAKGHDWLFPHLQPDRYGKRGGNWSKWWARWRKALGVDGSGKCFHAFRHTFKTACRNAGIEEEIHDAITGHSGGGIGRDYGDYPLEPLAAAMHKVCYPGFKFEWLWQATTAAWDKKPATPRKRKARVSNPRGSRMGGKAVAPAAVRSKSSKPSS